MLEKPGQPGRATLLREGVAAIGLFIERATARTPDGWFFHVYLGDELKGTFRRKADAKKLYEQLLAESGYQPPQQEQKPSRVRQEFLGADGWRSLARYS